MILCGCKFLGCIFFGLRVILGQPLLGLTLNDVPFVVGKVSDSQIMEVAAKLVIASNPTVNIFRIGRGESLGAKRLQSIVNLAKENGFQGFIEQVERGQETISVEEYREV